MDEKLKGKLQLLQLNQNKTKQILEKGNVEKIQRHQGILRTIISAVEALKIEVEQAKLEDGREIQEVDTWGKEIEAKTDEADALILYIQQFLDDVNAKQETEKRANEEALVAQQREKQLRFDKQQLEQKFALSPGNKPEGTQHVQLPKLKITPFDGSLEKWLSFWNKFEAEIDASNMPSVTKFAYLKELVDAKVREAIDGLPFTTEGYERAKNILKTEYGNVSEIVNAYIDNIISLPVITGTKPEKIHQFYHTLSYNVQSLESLGKLKECSGLVRSVLNKLKGIKPDLVRSQVGWQSWDFPQLTCALRTWKEIHPIEITHDEKPREKLQHSNRSFQSQQETVQNRRCVYCDDAGHKSVMCEVVKSPVERRQKLQEMGLCFNCTGGRHRAAQCRSRTVCHYCKKKHHSSICEQEGVRPAMTGLTAPDEGENVCHPVVVVEVNGVECRALLDTGASGSYASAFLLDLLKIKPARNVRRRIQTITGVVTKNIDLYNVTVSSTDKDCEIPVCVTRVERAELLSLKNPDYANLTKKYSHLKGVKMTDTDTKRMLPVHMILGANEYTKIKMAGDQRIGAMGEPVAEHTKLGWTIMSTGTEVNTENMFMTQTMVSDYERLCALDVLGLEDKPSGDQSVVHAEFLEQLQRRSEGWYETGLPWKGNHPALPNNEAGSLKRLESLVRRLKKTGMMEDYDAIIQNQLKEGIVEKAEMAATGTEFYIPHKAVVRENAESTKLRIVYDASARSNESAPSLNDCLEVGPPLQNQLWKVLVRGRFHAVALAGDIKQAFLQVRIREEDRDALRFHWMDGKDLQQLRTLRFTRALFGLGPSPFLLGGVIKHHLDTCRTDQPEIVKEIERSLYVDDLISGGQTVDEAKELKVTASNIFGKACFHLHKWNSNEQEVETSEIPQPDESISYAKQQLGVQAGESSLLGMKWNKQNDTIGVAFPSDVAQPTKRGILGKVARIYDPLGLVSPVTLSGKLLYREACNEKCPWDAPLSKGLIRNWQKWESQLPSQVDVPRSLASVQEPIDDISLHAFGDASGKGVAATVYAIVTQPTKVSQGLVAAKSRLAKQGLTIPRLELISAHMAVNLVNNVQEALSGFPVSEVHCWLDSTVALHWINGAGEYKQFVGNRVRKIQESKHVTWRHVPTLQNPADLGSRGGLINKDALWWNGPEWLSDRAKWPVDIVTQASPESQKEAIAMKHLFAMEIPDHDELDDFLSKHTLWRTLRVCAWIARFARNSRSRKEARRRGPLTTKEINEQKKFWIRRVQTRSKDKFEEDQLRLNLQPSEDGILECRGRIQGHYPVYIPDTSIYAEKFVQDAHEATLHGGVGLTMARIREHHWIPRLRRLVKRIVNRCPGCKRFQAVAVASPPPGLLPRDRTEGTSPFEVIGVDYAGPLTYKVKKNGNKDGKAYLLLYTCSLSRAVHLELLPTLETQDFLRSFKEFIARRGRPRKIYSDNGRTFVGAAKWLQITMRDEKFNDFLARNEISWQFNLSRAPWWGGQFERLVGLVKGALHKTIGRGILTWDELREVILDVEVAINSRPLSYVEDDLQVQTLTPNTLLFARSNQLPEQKAHHIENVDLRKRAKFLKRCKQALWQRWTKEYVRGLRERHNMSKGKESSNLSKGDVVIIRGDEKDRSQWKLGIIVELIEGIDGTVRAARLRAGKNHLERAIQQLYPLELSCDREPERPRAQLNAGAADFRPRRDAAVAADLRVKAVLEDEQ